MSTCLEYDANAKVQRPSRGTSLRQAKDTTQVATVPSTPPDSHIFSPYFRVPKRGRYFCHAATLHFMNSASDMSAHPFICPFVHPARARVFRNWMSAVYDARNCVSYRERWAYARVHGHIASFLRSTLMRVPRGTSTRVRMSLEWNPSGTTQKMPGNYACDERKISVSFNSTNVTRLYEMHKCVRLLYLIVIQFKENNCQKFF